jgi:TolB protein
MNTTIGSRIFHLMENGSCTNLFPKEIDPLTHPFYKRIYLRLMPVAGGVPKTIGYLYGGQGSMNVPSWSPDSRKIAFVSNSKL